MKFSIATKPITVTSNVKPMTVDQVSAAYEELICSYMGLTDAQRNLDEVCNVMDNINLSMQMLKTGGADAIKILNIDKSLESLCAVAEEKLTVQAAQEGLMDTLKAAWKTFIEWLKKVCRFIASIFDRLAGDSKVDAAAAEAAIRAAKDEAGKLMAAKTKKFIIAQKEAEFWKTATLEASAIIGKCEVGIKNLNEKLEDTKRELSTTQKELDENTEMLNEALAWIKPEEEKIIDLVGKMTSYHASNHGITDEYAAQTLKDLGWHSATVEEHAGKLKEFVGRTAVEIRKKSAEIDNLTEKLAEEVNKELGTVIKEKSAATIKSGLAKITKIRGDAAKVMFNYRRRMGQSIRSIASLVDGGPVDNTNPDAYEV